MLPILSGFLTLLEYSGIGPDRFAHTTRVPVIGGIRCIFN